MFHPFTMTPWSGRAAGAQPGPSSTLVFGTVGGAVFGFVVFVAFFGTARVFVGFSAEVAFFGFVAFFGLVAFLGTEAIAALVAFLGTWTFFGGGAVFAMSAAGLQPAGAPCGARGAADDVGSSLAQSSYERG